MRNCSDDCDQYHCRVCEKHYEPCKETSRICGDCYLDFIDEQTEAQAKAFGGNYEQAASYFGW